MNTFVYSWTCKELNRTTIRAYGIDVDGKSVCLRINDFTPYIYVRLSDGQPENDRMILRRELGGLLIYSEVVYKENLYNFQPGNVPFLFCQCTSRKHIQDIVYRLKTPINGVVYRPYEHQATSVLQMISLRGITAAGWVSHEGREVYGDVKLSVCDREYIVNWKCLSPSNEHRTVDPLVLSFDFEVNSDVANSMPADRLNDCIFQISCVLSGGGGHGNRRKLLLSLRATDYVDDEGRPNEIMADVEVRQYDSEEQLLAGFFALVHNERPNVVTGYNILGFDIPYLIKRCVRYFMYDDLCALGFNRVEPCVEKPIQLNKRFKTADKDKVYYIDWEGILIVDLLPIVQKDYKLDNYKLHTVATHFFDVGKDPITHKQIFKAFETKKMALVGKYCVQDSVLCTQLFDHLSCWIALSEMAKICNVSMFELYTQGQQFKIFCQVYAYCLNKNIVVDSGGYESKLTDRYCGAYVYDPEPGFYENVVPLDFSSLYPSIIISHNICYSTIASEESGIPDSACHVFEWEDHVCCKHDPRVIETDCLSRQIDELETRIKAAMVRRDTVVARGLNKQQTRKIVQNEINALRSLQRPLREARQKINKKAPEWIDENGVKVDGKMCASHRFRFLKADVKRGVIPVIIQNLLDSRKRIRDEMRVANDEHKVVLDKRQLAYKVSANSMYGAMGVRKGYLPFMPGAMCITYMGRKSIEKTASIIQNEWNGTLVYGDTDSNYVTFPSVPIDKLWDHAITVADAVSDHFPKPMRLEFEQKIYSKFLILSKKRYVYRGVNKNGVADTEIGKKGVVLAKRDNSGALKQIYQRVVENVFDGAPIDVIVNDALQFVDDMFRMRVTDDKFVITKSVKDCSGELTDDGKIGCYKVKALATNDVDRSRQLNGKTEREYYIASCPPQVRLAERMKLRGTPVDAGSRLEYVAIDKGLKCATLGDKIEDYDYYMFRKEYMKLDVLYYLYTFINPVDQLLDVSVQQKGLIENQYRYRLSFKKVMTELTDKSRPRLRQ